MVFRVFGFCAHLQILQIPHLALFQIPTNYPFYNINRGESGNRWGGQVFLCTQPCHSLELYHAPFVLADVPALGVVQNRPKSNFRKEPPPACDRRGEVVPEICTLVIAPLVLHVNPPASAPRPFSQPSTSTPGGRLAGRVHYCCCVDQATRRGDQRHCSLEGDACRVCGAHA